MMQLKKYLKYVSKKIANSYNVPMLISLSIIT